MECWDWEKTRCIPYLSKVGTCVSSLPNVDFKPLARRTLLRYYLIDSLISDSKAPKLQSLMESRLINLLTTNIKPLEIGISLESYLADLPTYKVKAFEMKTL